MQIKETIGFSLPGSVEDLPLKDMVVTMDSAHAACGEQRSFGARVRGVCNRDSGFTAFEHVEMLLVGSRGEVSGVLCYTGARSDTRGAIARCGPEEVSAIADEAQSIVHDINNLLSVIAGGLRLIECESDAAQRTAIVGKMHESIVRGALLSRQLLNGARLRTKSIDGFVTGSRLAAMAGMLDRVLRPDITVGTVIAPDLWNFNADPEELYFALLNLCRNSADAMPNGGAITVAARNVEPSADAIGCVEMVVADDGEGMTEEVLSQAFTPYFTTKVAGSGTGLGLPQVQRFAEGRGGAIHIESERGAGTRVRLFLPRVYAVELCSSIVGTEISYTPSANGGVFNVVDPAKATPTSWPARTAGNRLND